MDEQSRKRRRTVNEDRNTLLKNTKALPSRPSFLRILRILRVKQK